MSPRAREGGGSTRTRKYLWRQGQYEYSNKEIIEALRAAAPSAQVLTSVAYAAYARENDTPSLPVIIDRFGRWNQALAAADLSFNPSRKREYTRASSEDLIDALVVVSHALGDAPSITDYENYRRDHDNSLPSSVTVRKRLGGWMNAMKHLEERA